MKCPCCGAAELIHDTRDVPYIYKGDATTILAVKGDFCPACGEVVLNKEQGDRYGESIRQFQRQINATYVDPSFIATVRKKLKLDQREAAEMFGGGVNAFSRYEKGRAKPPLALVKFAVFAPSSAARRVIFSAKAAALPALSRPSAWATSFALFSMSP